jgi:hypothetical protein
MGVKGFRSNFSLQLTAVVMGPGSRLLRSLGRDDEVWSLNLHHLPRLERDKTFARNIRLFERGV